MGSFLQILAIVISGVILLWFGYSLFFGSLSPAFRRWKSQGREYNKGNPGDPQICPICSVRLKKGEQVKTTAFPYLSGSKDRLMYIRGCYNCLENTMPRRCPICGIDLDINDFLISRMFERAKNRNHVHVLGCNHCKKTGNIIR